MAGTQRYLAALASVLLVLALVIRYQEGGAVAFALTQRL
jgi:hypothetical protein